MSHREMDDSYMYVVGQLGPDYRLIECKDDLQWVLQEKDKSGRWRNHSFLSSRDGVRRRTLGMPNAESLSGLPDRYKPRSSRLVEAGK